MRYEHVLHILIQFSFPNYPLLCNQQLQRKSSSLQRFGTKKVQERFCDDLTEIITSLNYELKTYKK